MSHPIELDKAKLPDDPHELAQLVAAQMYAKDSASQGWAPSFCLADLVLRGWS